MPGTNKLGANITNEKGLSLIEVVAALYIAALIVMVVFSTSASSSLWTTAAREDTLASAYAASITDVLRNNTVQLQTHIENAGSWTATDENPADDQFAFTIHDQVITMKAPGGVDTIVTASYFDERRYYDGVSPSGIFEIGIGDDAIAVYFHHNLIEVNVELLWASGTKDYRLSTILGVR